MTFYGYNHKKSIKFKGFAFKTKKIINFMSNQLKKNKMIIKPTHASLTPGKKIGEKTYTIELVTLDASVTADFNKQTKHLDITGTFGFWPQLDPISNILPAVWELLMSFGGRMDVVASISKDVAISFNNPTFGYPYTVFVDANQKKPKRYNYYVGESYTYTDSMGIKYTVTRNKDTNNKEFKVLVNN